MAEKKSTLESIALKKREILIMKLKLSSGEQVNLKELRGSKKEVARLLTKISGMKSS